MCLHELQLPGQLNQFSVNISQPLIYIIAAVGTHGYSNGCSRDAMQTPALMTLLQRHSPLTRGLMMTQTPGAQNYTVRDSCDMHHKPDDSTSCNFFEAVDTGRSRQCLGPTTHAAVTTPLLGRVELSLSNSSLCFGKVSCPNSRCPSHLTLLASRGGVFMSLQYQGLSLTLASSTEI